jgi:hypothetical protein
MLVVRLKREYGHILHKAILAGKNSVNEKHGVQNFC